MRRNSDNGDDEWEEPGLTSSEEEHFLAIRAAARQLLYALGFGDYRMADLDLYEWFESAERELLFDVAAGDYEANFNDEDGETASLTLSSSSHNSLYVAPLPPEPLTPPIPPRRQEQRQTHPAFRQISDMYPPSFPLLYAGGVRSDLAPCKQQQQNHPAFREISDLYPPNFPLWYAGVYQNTSRP